MQKWEYMSLHEGSWNDTKANELGAEGWELVTTTNNEGWTLYLIFKRPMEED